MDEQFKELAQTSQNFGFLLPHEPLLVLDGATAESYIYSDPDAAMWKARRFTETLAKRLIWLSQIKVNGNDQAKRIKALADAGVVPLAQRNLFDRVRTTGNRAVHTYYGNRRAALTAVKNCFDLGYWFHRAMLEDRARVPLLAFVPPPDQQTLQASENAADQAELDELRRELNEYRRRLIDVNVRRDAKATQLEAETRARGDAEQALQQARADHDRLQALLADADERTRDLQAAFETQLQARRKVTAVERDRLVEGAQKAAAQPLTENEVREHVDDMLRAAGWAVQDMAQVNLYAADGVAVREVGTAAGPADYLLWVDRKLVGVIEAKRQGTILTPVEGQSGRYADNLTASQQMQAWRMPLPFRYETTATETHFTNALDPLPRARDVFGFHRPETLARWMREADADEQAPTLRARLRRMPELDERGLRPAQIRSIRGLEKYLAADQQRALIQMATGAGKTYTAVTQSYRLLKHAKARRIPPADQATPRRVVRVGVAGCLRRGGERWR